MARSGRVKTTLAAVSGVSSSAVEQLDRKLGSMGLLPRQRGRYGEHYQSIHLARLVVGVLIMADGIEHTAQSVIRILPLIAKGPLTTELPVGTTEAGLVRDAVLFDLNRAFINVAAAVLDRLAFSPNGDGSHYLALGLSFGASAVAGWVEWQIESQRDAPRRDYYGQWKKVQSAGFKREARFERSALLMLADLLKPEDDE